jgi:hypothetical protein
MSEEKTYHPEEHYYEEQRNDLLDTGIGFGVMFGICAVIFLVLSILKG